MPLRKCASAAAPSPATATRCPSSSSASLIASCIARSSSTISTNLPGIAALLRRDRQPHCETGPLAESALHVDPATGRLDNLPRDPQPEAEPAVMALRHGPLEPLEDASVVTLFDADPVVAHLEHGVAGLPTQQNVDG